MSGFVSKFQYDQVKAEYNALLARQRQYAMQLVGHYIKDGIIEPEARDTYVNLLVSDQKSALAVLQHQRGTHPDYTNEAWGFMEWSKKNPAGLIEMQKNNPERYNRIRREYLDTYSTYNARRTWNKKDWERHDPTGLKNLGRVLPEIANKLR